MTVHEREGDDVPAQDAAPDTSHDAAAQASTEHRQGSSADLPLSPLTGAVAARRWLVQQVRTAEVPLFGEFVDQAWRLWPGRENPRDGATAWGRAHTHVQRALDELGLAASVWRTSGVVPIAEHDPDVAGLVLLHAPGRPDWPTPVHDDPSGAEQALRARMYERHGLVPGPLHQADPWRWCGQGRPHRPPPWCDHARTWLDPRLDGELSSGELVLTVEPYAFDPAEVVADLAGLPLVVDGPYPGVRNDSTILLVLRPDQPARPLPAEQLAVEVRTA